MKMKKHGFFKKVTALAAAAMMTFSVLSSCITAFADTKTPESKITDWGYNFSGSGLPNAYDHLLKVTATARSAANGQTISLFGTHQAANLPTAYSLAKRALTVQ